MTESPATLIRDILVADSIASLPEDDDEWPITVGSQPATPDEFITVYDTSGTRHSRILATGENVFACGVQVRVRAGSYSVGWAKIWDICEALSAILREQVNSVDMVQSVDQQGPAMHIGVEDDKTRRDLFTANFLVHVA